MIPPTAGVILAGGRATRMGGGDKCRILVGGIPIIHRIRASVGPQVAALALNANGESARFADLGLPVLPDLVPCQPGPLAGVLVGMDWAAGLGLAWLVTVPGDAPHLPPDLVARLHAVRTGEGGACARSGGRLHPATALWPVAARDRVADALLRGCYRVQGAAGPVAVADWTVDPVDPFLNLNTPDDLA